MAHLAHSIRTSAAARVSAVRQMRSETRSALARHRARREASRHTVKRALQENRAAVIASLHPADEPGSSTAGRSASQAHRPMEHRSVWDFTIASAPSGPAATFDPLVPQVLRVIQAHPDGIGAIDVGNALGIDWRHVPGIARELLEGGVIEQVAQDYYPARKASGTW